MKRALVTGANSGIGKAIASVLRANEWEIIELNHAQLDLDNLNAVTKFADEFNEPIDALIHVAGVWHDKNSVMADKKLEDFKPEEISRAMNVGLISFMILSSKILPRLSQQGIVIGITGTFSDGGAGWLPYYTSKRALEDFLQGLAEDYPNGPKVYGVSPSDTATEAYKKFYPEYAQEAQSPEVVAQVCLSLINGKAQTKSGDILVIKDGKLSEGFHS